jgi:hypothetical protein
VTVTHFSKLSRLPEKTKLRLDLPARQMRWERACATALREEIETQVEGDIPLRCDVLSHSETVLQVL